MKKVNETKFYQALERIFVGADVEGASGFVNLLKIKSEYYKIIISRFKKDVDNEEIIRDSFKEEFFDRLYSFFEKYFSESGSVYFVKTANWQKVYEQVYTDNKDVMLFWKTNMLYYVKSDILFQSMDAEITDDETGKAYKFFFDAGGLCNKQNNEKKEIVFTLKHIKEESNGRIYVFDIAYSERGLKTKTEEIGRQTKLCPHILEKAFGVFKKQAEVDFFINKNAKKFLSEQLDIYLHQILLDTDNKFDQERLNQLKTVKVFAQKIIDFISQFEDELVRVWNKPKFALDSNYVITIDKLSSEIIDKLSRHPGLKSQIKEWQDLGIAGPDFDFAERNSAHKYLPVDTKYFKDLEIDILGLFDNLDEALDGRLIHSENYQALNTLQEKYKEKIQCIYIDPPFNLGDNSDFAYKVNYKDSSWATLLENRLTIAKRFLSDRGALFIRCDYNGNWIIRPILDDKLQYRNEIVISKSAKLTEAINKYHSGHDSLYFYTKSAAYDFNTATKKRDDPQWRAMHLPGIRWSPIPEQFINVFSRENIIRRSGKFCTRARIILGKEILPPEGRHWALSQVDIFSLERKGKIRLGDNGQPQTQESDEQRLTDNWTDWVGYSSIWGFNTENHEKIVERAIKTSSLQESDIILDFFLGSGTTIAVSQKLRKKWIGIEMGQQFLDIIIPRMKEILAGKGKHEPTGISKDTNWQGGGFFKYYSLEQYEDTLRNMKYKTNTPSDIFNDKKPFEQYIFYADNKFADVLKVDSGKIETDFDNLYGNIDFAESISNLKGLPIKKITKTGVLLEGSTEEIKTDYKNMTDEEKLNFVRLLKPFLWWGKE